MVIKKGLPLSVRLLLELLACRVSKKLTMALVTTSRGFQRNRVRRKSSKATRSYGMPNSTTSSLFLIPSVTNWCTTRELSIPRPFKPTLTDTEPPAKTCLHPSDLRIQVSPCGRLFGLWTLSLGKRDHSGPRSRL